MVRIASMDASFSFATLEPKINSNENRNQKIFADALETDFRSSNSMFAAVGGAGRQFLGPAD
ncbi:hypothetical protein [Bradyrhizobium sp.]|uniref:hypothetical protein n=1 Tax=Bradyrhizobium sp. TaxID=376 RepID=UPI003C3498CB